MRVAIYARVSTDRGEQDPQVQVSALEKWLLANGHIVIDQYVDHISGTKSSRPALDELLAEVTKEDTFIEAIAIVKLDRLARSMKHLIELGEYLDDNGVDLMVKDQAIDTTTPAGKLMFHMLGAIAEFERALIAERTKAGLVHARECGVTLGRPTKHPTVTPETAKNLIKRHGSARAAEGATGIGRNTINRLAKLTA